MYYICTTIGEWCPNHKLTLDELKKMGGIAFGTVPKFILKIIERDKIDPPNTHIHDRTLDLI